LKASWRVAMARKIVWATDFSETSRYVGSFLLAVSKKSETEILLLHVFPDIAEMYGPFIPQTANIIALWESAKEKAEKTLESWAKEWKEKGLNLTPKLVIGSPVEETIREAVRFQASCIAVGTKGLTGLKGLLLGSFAKSLLRTSPVPVLTLRFPHVKLEKILVPVDLSPATDFVLKYLPKIEDLGKITLYHAVVVDFFMEEEEKEELRRRILEEMPRYPGADVVVDIVYNRSLDIVQAIVDYAEKNRYDLIVQTSHGRSGIEKVIFGSVAEGVITRSHVPVLTLNMKTMKAELLR